MITFDRETHTYLNDGVIIPSVTSIIKAVNGTSYNGVPAAVLEAKAEYGNRVHEWIEHYCLTGEELEQTRTMKMSTDQFKNWKDGIEITSVEQPVMYKELYAGTYDMKGYYNGKPALFDIKTTISFDEDYLSWQLSMYQLALGEKLELYCIWLPKAKRGQIKRIPEKNEKDIIKLLETYQEGLNEQKKAILFDYAE